MRNCSLVANSNGTNNGNAGCFCNANYQWTGSACSQGGTTSAAAELTTPLSIDCKNVINSIGFGMNPNTCVCKDGYYWTGRGCSRRCSSVMNSNGINDSDNSCICNSGYIWEANSGQCVLANAAAGINCATIQYSSGVAAPNGGCTCNPGFYWFSGSCARDCKAVANSNGIAIGTDVCLCNDNYFWTGSTCSNGSTPPEPPAQPTPVPITPPTPLPLTSITPPKPALNCSFLAFTVSNNGPDACNCVTNYVWTGSNCVRNCSTVSNSNGMSGVGDTCQCNRGFKWSGQQCVSALLGNVDCLNLPFSLGWSTNQQSCICQNGYTFRTSACVPVGQTGLVTGPTLPNAVTDPTGTLQPSLSGSNGTDTSNTPTSGLTIPSVNPIQPALNCSNIRFTNGPGAGLFVCNCISGYYWINNLCVLNCNSIPMSTGDRIDINTCICKSPYIWQNNQCALNCSSFPNSASLASYNTCNCQPHYVWNNNQCSYDCSKVVNSDGRSADNSRCNCKTGYYFVENLCKINCSGMENTKEAKNADECVCADGYEWKESHCKKKSSNLGLILGLSLGIGIPLLLGLGIFGIYKCCTASTVPLGPLPSPGPMMTGPTPMFPPLQPIQQPTATQLKQDPFAPSISTLPPNVGGFSNRYI